MCPALWIYFNANLAGIFIFRLSNHQDLPERGFKLHLKFSKEVCKTKPAKVTKILKNISHTPFFNYLFRRKIYIYPRYLERCRNFGLIFARVLLYSQFKTENKALSFSRVFLTKYNVPCRLPLKHCTGLKWGIIMNSNWSRTNDELNIDLILPLGSA